MIKEEGLGTEGTWIQQFFIVVGQKRSCMCELGFAIHEFTGFAKPSVHFPLRREKEVPRFWLYVTTVALDPIVTPSRIQRHATHKRK